MPLSPPEHEVHVGDIGTSFRGTAVDTDATGKRVVVDITGATIFWRFERPAATRYDRTATVVDGPTGIFEYITVSGDVDKAGDWKRQAHITLPSQGQWWTSLIPYPVADFIPVPV